MGDFAPSIPIQLQIRKIIFEKFNDIEQRFTNDEIFEIIQQNQDVDKSWTVDDMESFFNEICDKGLARNIAQNLTTIWFKLFSTMEKFHCDSCSNDIFLGKEEERICPNPTCNASI